MHNQDSYASFMLDHAAGNHAEALELAGDLHMLLSPAGAETAQLLSIVGGALLERDPQMTKPPKAHSEWRRTSRRASQTATELLAMSEANLSWKRGMSGLAYVSTATRGAKFIRLEPGQSTPAHGHGAMDATVVLKGRFSDGHGVYCRGDLVLGEPGKRHKPAAVGGEPCLCFVAETSNPLWNLFR